MTLYTIKPLKWIWISDGRWVADSVIGRFVVRFNGRSWEWHLVGQTASVYCDSVEDGKEKANARNHELLMGALEPVEVPDHDRPPGAERP